MRFLPVLGCLILGLLTGCAYRLGPTNGDSAGARSLKLSPFNNQTMEPRLGDAVTTALRRQLQRDGTYRLATHDDADITVSGILTRYHRNELSFAPNDVLTTRDFRITVTAKVTAVEHSTGKTLFDREVTGYTLVRVGSDLTSSERQALPLLADDLAKNIMDLLVDGSW